MTTPTEPIIPEEILRSEQQAEGRQPYPLQSGGPTTLGLPGLPADIVGVIVHYGPWLILFSAIITGFGAVGSFLQLSDPGYAAASNPYLPLAIFLGLAASIAQVLVFPWLKTQRRLGWNILAIAFIVQYLSQFLLAGVSSILFAGAEVLITAYLMLQVRDSFNK